MSSFWAGAASVTLGGFLAVLGSLVVNRRQAQRAQRVECFHRLAAVHGRVVHFLQVLDMNGPRHAIGLDTLPEDVFALRRLAQAVGPDDAGQLTAAVDVAQQLLSEDPYRSDDPTRAVDRTQVSVPYLEKYYLGQIADLERLRAELVAYDAWLADRLARRL